MNDCSNADVRDLLPDLAHGRLDAATRRMVEQHVDGCADCAAELALLGDLRATLQRTPALDLTAIVAAVPAYRAPARHSWVGWRTAAAITMVVAGGSSLLVFRGGAPVGSDSVAVGRAPVESGAPAVVAMIPPNSVSASAGAPASISPPPAKAGPPASSSAVEGRELAMAGGALGELTDVELADLLKDIESLDALPSVEVEQSLVSPISPRRTP